MAKHIFVKPSTILEAPADVTMVNNNYGYL